MKNIFEDIENYIQTRELILVILLTGLLLFLSFIGHTKFSTTEITIEGEKHTIYVSYYGFPCEMIGILNPITGMEYYWVWQSGGGLIRVLWEGLLLNSILYFLVSLAVIYLFRRLGS